jgi:hypothetical protein
LQQAFTAKRHGRIEFPINDIQGLIHTGFTPGAETIDKGPPDVGVLRAQANCLEYILPGANAAVEMHFDIVADFCNDTG